MNYKKRVIELLKPYLNMSEEELREVVYIPSGKNQGDYCVQCFKISKIIGGNPNAIAKRLKELICCEEFEKIQNTGPYLNFFINKVLFAKDVVKVILNEKDKYGLSNKNKDQMVCIECIDSTIKDILKIKNMFCTIFGQSLYRLLKSQGYEAVTIGYIDDSISERDMNIINEVYSKLGSSIKSFEDKSLYEDVSNRIINDLNNIHMIDRDGETSYISLKEYNMAPYILKNNDKELSRSIRTLSSVFYRKEKYKYSKNIYINDYINSYNFEQLSKIFQKYDGTYYENCTHISEGIIKFFDNKEFYCNVEQITFSDFKNSIIIKLIEDSKENIEYGILEKRAKNIIIFSLIRQFGNNNIIFDFSNMSSYIRDDNFLYVEKIYNTALNIIIQSRNMVLDSHISICEKEFELIKELYNFNMFIQLSIHELNLQHMINYILNVSKYVSEIFIEDNKNMFMGEINRNILIASIQVIENACAVIGINIRE